MKLDMTTELMASGLVVRLQGDVDMNTSRDIPCLLDKAFAQATAPFKALFIDLSGVRYMDSSGIATLVEILQQCGKTGTRLRLCALSPSVRDVFELARLGSVFQIYPTLDEASQHGD
ncbi:MAG: STAS domain-containing protein [Nitrospirota bacterium]